MELASYGMYFVCLRCNFDEVRLNPDLGEVIPKKILPSLTLGNHQKYDESRLKLEHVNRYTV